MRYALLATLALACRAPAASSPSATSHGPQAPTTLDPAAIDAWLAAELKSRGIVGASVVIVHDGATVLAKGYGTRIAGKQEAIDANTAFHVGSVGKQLTCAVVTLLADEGKLKLTDPVAKYYPELVRANDITLDDLGAHISGYRDYYPMDYMDARFTKPIEPDALIARYGRLPLDFEPRARHSYSNTGYLLLGRIAEKVSGKPLSQLLEERVFKPLRMTNTTAGSVPAGSAVGHDSFLLSRPEPRIPEAAGWMLGMAGVWSSAADLAKWDLAFSSGEILSEEGRRAMATAHRTSDGREVLYGCGLGTRVQRGEVVLSHTGAVEGFQSYNTFVPRIRAAVILLANDFHTDVRDLHSKLVQLVLDRPGEVPVIPGPSAEDTARAFVRQLQDGTLDRSKLGEDLDAFFDPQRIAEASVRLRALGEPRVTLVERYERGNMEATVLELAFPKKTLQARMFRSTLGKIHQFQITE